MLDAVDHYPPGDLARHLVAGDRLVEPTTARTAALVLVEIADDHPHLEMVVAAPPMATRAAPLATAAPGALRSVAALVATAARGRSGGLSRARSATPNVIVEVFEVACVVSPLAAPALRAAERDLRERRHLRPQRIVLLPQGGDRGVLGRQLLDRRAGRANHAGETTDRSGSCPVLCQQPHRAPGCPQPTSAQPGPATPWFTEYLPVPSLGLHGHQASHQQAAQVGAHRRGGHLRGLGQLAGGEHPAVEEGRHHRGAGPVGEELGRHGHVDIHVSTLPQTSRP